MELVKRFEGFRPRALRLADGGWTIGYGHTASAREGATITEEEGEMLLLYDLDRVARAIDGMIFTPLSENQFNALVAFAFNVGVESFEGSTVLMRVNEGELLQAAAELELWRRADFGSGSLVLDALVRRRAAEKALFLTPGEDFRTAPTPMVRPRFDDPLHPHSAEPEAPAVAAPNSGGEPPPEDPLGSAVLGLSARLREIFPPEPPVEAPASEAPVEAAEQPLPEEPALEPEPEPEAETVEEELEPPPETPSEPLVEETVLAEEAAAAPRPALPEPPPAPPSRPEPGLWPEYAEPRIEPAPPRAHRKRRRAAPTVVLLVGVAGVFMFVAALLAMIYGRATVANLAIGLVGVVCIAPAGVVLLARAFGERPDI